jgi:hypothetical protein
VLSVSRYDGPSGDLMARESRSFDEMGQPWETRRYFKPSGAPANPDSVTRTWRNARGQPIGVEDPNINVTTMSTR